MMALSTALALALLLSTSASLWILRRARQQAKSERRAREDEIRSYVEERERISQDLHDNVIQSVYAVGLGLEHFRHGTYSPAEMERRLNTAISGLNSVMRDVRQFIGGLEPTALNGHELKTALKSLALTTGGSSQFDIQVDTAATRLLTSHQATHLLNIAKEAMSNSLQHAKARQTIVTVSRRQCHVRLEISDNGIGFDPQQTLPKGKAGLRNISSRAGDMNAQLELHSTPGQGTLLSVTVPVHNLGLSHDTGVDYPVKKTPFAASAS